MTLRDEIGEIISSYGIQLVQAKVKFTAYLPNPFVFADKILSLISSQPSEFEEVKVCEECFGDGHIHMSTGIDTHPCSMCEGSGEIVRILTQSEVNEIFKNVILKHECNIKLNHEDHQRYLLLHSGGRVRVRKEEK